MSGDGDDHEEAMMGMAAEADASITRATAEGVLGRALGGTVRLGDPEPIAGGRTHVFRFGVLGGPAGTPPSVVVKRARLRGDEAYDPSATDFRAPAWRLLSDWAGLRFLGEVSGEEPLAPRFLAGDREAGVLVMEDLGPGEDAPDRLLLGDEPRAAELALVELAAALGRMHARSIGRETVFLSIRGELGRLAREPRYRVRLRDAFRSARDVLGVGAPPGADAEMDALVRAIDDPGPFLAYTHGDPCPDNWLRSDRGLRLIDFEVSRWGHALIDGAYGRIHFPTCWCVNRLPDPLPSRMEAAYRAELAEGCSAAGDDVLFGRAVVEACAYHVVSGFPGERLAELLDEDRGWGVSTLRQRALLRFEILAHTTQELGRLEAIGATYGEMASALRARWGAETDAMPLYPAFRRGAAAAD